MHVYVRSWYWVFTSNHAAASTPCNRAPVFAFYRLSLCLLIVHVCVCVCVHKCVGVICKKIVQHQVDITETCRRVVENNNMQ